MAVDAASNGDVIELSSGDFGDFSTNKTLTIVSESFAASNIRANSTTLDGGNIVTAGGDVTFRGLRLVGTKPVVADGGRFRGCRTRVPAPPVLDRDSR
jgi:hypothetical protein